MCYKGISLKKKNFPDYHRFYKVQHVKTDFEKLNATYYKNQNIEALLTDLYRLRHFNPINHSSAEIIEDETLNENEINELIRKSEKLLIDSF